MVVRFLESCQLSISEFELPGSQTPTPGKKSERDYSTTIVHVIRVADPQIRDPLLKAICFTGFLCRKLRTFAPIATAHRYCAREFTRHVMHRARAPRDEITKDREDGHCYNFPWI